MKKQRCFLFILFLFFLTELCYPQQNLTVSGAVTSGTDGDALIGVSVVLKGTQVGTVTDIDGKYSISAPKGSKLVFSYLGMITEEQTVNSSVLDVILHEDNQSLDEVVVIGYGSQRKSDITGTITSIKANELIDIPTPNLSTALQGKAAGVQISPATGAPGSNSKVRIRGISSFNGGDPLWIVDGVEQGEATVNPSDIESIEILKDASTAAIYGSRGANGVILITTKKGKKGAIQTNLNAYYGIQEKIKDFDMANAQEFGAYIYEVQKLNKVRPNKMTFQSFDEIAGLQNYNHQQDILQYAPIKNIDFNVSGGGEKTLSYFAVNYMEQDGFIKGSSYDKFNVRFNSSYEPASWLKIGQNTTFTSTNTHGIDEGSLLSEYFSPFMHAVVFSPFNSMSDENGNFNADLNFNNPATLAIWDNDSKLFKNYNLQSSAYVIIEPIKNLKFESRLTGSLNFGEGRQYNGVYTVTGNPTSLRQTDQITRDNSRYSGWIWQNILSYNTTIMNDFNLGAMIGMESSEAYNHNMSGTRLNLLGSGEEMWYFDASKDQSSASQIVKGGGEESADYSYLGRVSLDYKGKYLGQFNFRRDYSSKFGPDNRAGNFPSFSLGWKFTEEEFMKGVDWLTFGKVRYGWGRAGNNAVPNYGYYGTVSTNGSLGYIFGGGINSSTGAAPATLVNRQIHWETIETNNIGIDLGFFNSRLSFTADYFTRENIGMLMKVPIPALAGWQIFDEYHEGGAATAFSNAGKLKNSGVELSLGWKDNVSKDFKYSVDVNATFMKNEAVDLKGEELLMGDCRGIGGKLTKTVAGGGIGDFYGYKVDRIFQESDGYLWTDPLGREDDRWIITNQPYTLDANGNKVYAQPDAVPGDYKWQDANGDGVIDSKDAVKLGDAHPKFLLGATMNFAYKWFDLSLVLQGAFGQSIFNGVNAFLLSEGTATANRNLPKEWIDGHYRPEIKEGDQVVLPARQEDAVYANKNSTNYTTMSDIYIENGSYLKLSNVQVGFTLPAQWTQKMKFKDIRVYCGIRNALTFTSYSGMEPELNSNDPLQTNIDKAGYPIPRTYTFGLNVKF